MSRKRPNILIRAVIKAIGLTGHQYVRLPFAADRRCNICGYEGPFRHSGLYEIRPDALCKSCWSTDRERLYARFLESKDSDWKGLDILHFAPERVIREMLRSRAARYVTADLYSGAVDRNWNVEDIDVADDSFDLVVCCHVLEHVDTPKALREIRRVLRPGGEAHLMIPIYEGLERTYTNPAVRTDAERYLHYHQADHVRLIGRDFRDQVAEAGFDLSEFSASGEDAATHGLRIGERVFVARPDKSRVSPGGVSLPS